MRRRLFISTAVLALSITLRVIPITAQLNGAQPNEKHKPVPEQVSSGTGSAKRQSPTLTLVAAIQPTAETPKSSTQQHEENVYVQRQIAVASGKAARFTLYLVFVGIGFGLIQGGLLYWQSLNTARSAKAALASAQAALAAQRPYVSLSHYPPGLEIGDFITSGTGQPNPSQTVSIKLKVQNDGTTPAAVTSIVIQPHFGFRLPKKPRYKKAHWREVRVTLPKGDHVDHERHWELPHVKLSRIKAALAENPLKLWMIGYVEYRDLSGTLRRTGYGRVYDPWADSNADFRIAQGVVVSNRPRLTLKPEQVNNLPLIEQAGYNYDVEVDESGKPQG